MKKWFFSFFLLGILIPTYLLSLDKILYIPLPKAANSNTYPQQESSSYFLQQMLLAGFAALPDWEITTELPTNTQNIALYRLETMMEFFGSVNRPQCIYTYTLYNNKNKAIFTGITTNDIRYGMLDAADVAIFGGGKALGQDLSAYTVIRVTLPPLGMSQYSFYLNKNKLFILSNTEPITLEYRLLTNQTYSFTIKEAPSLQNLWLGKTLWQKDLTLFSPTNISLSITLNTILTIQPVKTEVFLVPAKSYTLTIFNSNTSTSFTNTILPLYFEQPQEITLPFGNTYILETKYTNKNKNIVVDSKTIFASKTSLNYQPLDRIQTRPFYPRIRIALWAPLDRGESGFPLLLEGSGALCYYPTMNSWFGIQLGALKPFIPSPEAPTIENSVGSLALFGGWYPFSKKYDPIRLFVEGYIGWHSAKDITLIDNTSSPLPPEASDRYNQLLTGVAFEIGGGIELSVFSIGFHLWAASRKIPTDPYNLVETTYENKLISGIVIVAKVTL
jgi:hypothetical protein